MPDRANPNNGIMPPEPPDSLLDALRRMLQPLIRLLIARGISFPLLSGLLKGIYIDAAQRYFAPKEGRITDSRISVMTGVHRKDVRRLREAPQQVQQPPRVATLGARMIGVWTGDPRYQDDRGRPRPLERAEFEQLALVISRDVHPRTLLDEWCRRGMLEVVEADGRVHLCREAYVPSDDADDLAYFFGRNLHDHVAAAGENLLGGRPPHLEQAVYYPRLTAQSIAELQQFARQRATAVLHELNQEILTRIESDRNSPEATHRFCFGVYSYTDDAAGGGKQ